MYIIYDFIFLLYALVYLPYLLMTNRAYKGFAMRFGFLPDTVVAQLRQRQNIWLHAVSVGEVMLLDGFIDLVRKEYPAYRCVVTVTTKTGLALAQERLQAKAVVIPSPLDFSFVAKRFVELINPKIYIGVETEIWPNLYRQLFIKKIPLTVINGRISDNSFGRYKMIGFLLKGILNQVSCWCMQSQRDAERILLLGAEPSRVVITGNLKFDGIMPAGPNPFAALANHQEFWWVAGSTHSGEEEIVLDAYQKIIKNNPAWRLIIAPRHIERVPQILDLVSRRGFKAVKLSDIPPPQTPPTRGGEITVIVVDTIGQLRSLYAIASLVFVGKSLGAHGGQNIIEPAFFGKAIVVGPYMENFRDITVYFKQAHALMQVNSIADFMATIQELSADQVLRSKLGKAAFEMVQQNQGTGLRCLQQLEVFLK